MDETDTIPSSIVANTRGDSLAGPTCCYLGRDMQRVLNASAKGIRRFHSLSPAARKPSDQSDSVQQQKQQIRKSTHRRSLSCSSSQNLFKRDGCNILTHRQSISRDQHFEDEYEVQPPVLYKKHTKEVQNTSIEYDEEDEEYTTDPSFLMPKSERKNVDVSRQRILKTLNQYRLQDSKPRKKKNFYDVYNTYMRDYVQKDYKVLPHLQPNRLQPYGTVHKHAIPSRPPKMVCITYPIKEPGYTDQVTKSHSGSRTVSKKRGQPNKQKREYCTNSDHDLSNKHKDTVVECQKTVPVNNSSVESHSGGFFRKTIKILSDFKGSSNKKKADSIENCNEIINEYKKLNPNYTSVKKEVKSGSLAEKEAVTRALNFVAIYKNRYNNKIFDKPASHDQILNHKRGSTSKVQLREHHEGNENRPSQSNLAPNEKTHFEGETCSLGEKPLPQPAVESHNSIASVKVRAGTKVDLLQSNVMPEMIKQRKTPLDKNERLVSPWPSYAETRKRTVTNQKNIIKFNEIIYPSLTDNQKPKSAANQVIMLPSPQPVLTSSTRSLHRIKSDRSSKGTDKRPSSSINGVCHHSRKSNGVQNSNIKKAKSTTQVCSYIPRGMYVSGQNNVAVKNLQLVNFKRYKSSSTKGKKKKDPILNTFAHICDECPPKPTPHFDSFDCPVLSRKTPVDVPPLKRLKKRPVTESPKECPKPQCPPRADANYKIKRKKLQRIVFGDCKPVQYCLKEGSPIPRLKKVKISQPRVCPCIDPKCDCPPRADEGLQIEKKCLPKLSPSKCLKVLPKCPVDVPPLKRLKLKITQPRVCKEEDKCPPRADEGMIVRPKKLPKIEPAECPCIEKKPLENVNLKRLPKFKPKDPPCPPVPDECEEIIRADDACQYTVKPKQLSTMILKEHNNCVSVRQFNKQKHSKNNRSKREYSTWININRQNQSVYSIIKNPWGFICRIWNRRLDFNWISAFLRLVRGKTSLIPVESKTLDSRSDKCSFISSTRENNSTPNAINNKTKKKGLPTYHKSHKIHHPVRCSIYPSVCENLINKNRHIYTSAIRSKKKNHKCELSQNKKCKKIIIPKCPQTATNNFMHQYKFKKGEKIQTPYPSFSEWDQIAKSKTCERAMVRYQKFLRPRHSITAESEILKPPPPEVGTVRIEKEEGETREYENFYCLKQPFNGKEMRNEVEWPVKDGEACQLRQPICKTSSPVCEPKLPEYNPKPEPKARVLHKITQYGSEEEKRQTNITECQSPKKKGSKRKFVPASSKKQIGIFAKICNYFKAKPNCPKPENCKRKKLADDVKYAQKSPANCPPCKPSKEEPCKPKKEDPCEPKKKDPSKPKKEDPCKHSSKESCRTKKDLCKKYGKFIADTFDPLARETCTYAYSSEPCSSPVPPYPSSLKCQPSFIHYSMKASENTAIKQRPQTVHKLEKDMGRKNKIKNSKKDRRNYSTMSFNARAIEFYEPKKFSSNSNGDSKFPTRLLNKTKSNKQKENLHKRLLVGIEDGIRKLETQQDLNVSNNSYYKNLNILETLSENGINELFEEEPLFNPFEPLKEDVRDIVSFVCKFDSRDQQTKLFHNDISFERRCVGISDANAQIEELRITEAFRNFCNKITEVSPKAQRDYEEAERFKTEKMKKELNKLLEKNNQRTK